MMFVNRRVLVVICCLLGLSACFDSSVERETKYFNKAQAYVEEENYDKARVELKNVLQINAKNAEARYLLAQVEEKEKNWQKMFANLSAVIELDPEHNAAQLDLGKLYMISKDFDQALQKAELVISKQPENVDALTLKSAIMLMKGEIDEGKALLQQVLQLQPGHYDATLLMVKVLGSEKKTAEAIQLLDESLVLNPDNLQMSLVKVQILASTGNKQGAEDVLKSLLESHKENQKLHFVLAKFYASDNRLDDAEAVLRDLTQRFPDDAEPNLMLVNFLAQKKNKQLAMETLEGLVEKYPQQYKYRFTLLNYYKDQPEKQKAVLSQIIEDDKLGVSGLEARNRLAVMAIAEKDLETAKSLVEEVIVEDQRNSQSLMLRAGISIEEKDYDSAIADLRTVLKDIPDSQKALLFLATAHMKNGQVDLAQEALEKTLVVNPTNIIANKDLAKILVSKGDLDSAAEKLQQAHKAHEKNPEIMVMLIDLNIRRKQWDQAEAMAKLLGTLPDHKTLSSYKLGQLHFLQEQYKEAIAAFTSVLKVKPKAVDAMTGLINSHMKLGDSKTVEKLLNDAVAENADTIPFYLLRGEYYFKQQRFAEVEQDYKKILEINPNFVKGYSNLAAVYLAQKQVDKALNVFAEGLQKFPDSIGLLMGSAAINETNNREAEAIKAYQKVLALMPDNYLALNNMVALQIRTETDQQKLRETLTLAAPLKDSEVAAFLDTYGWLSYLNGEYDASLTALEKAIIKQADIPEIHYHLGMAYMQKGRTEEAKLAFEKAIANDAVYFGVDEAKKELQKLNNG